MENNARQYVNILLYVNKTTNKISQIAINRSYNRKCKLGYYRTYLAEDEKLKKYKQYIFVDAMVGFKTLLVEINKIVDENERNKKLKELNEKEGSVNRLFMGRTKGNSSGLFLAGPDGKPKMMIYVDEQGNPKIQTFNSKGEIKDFIESN